jgi:hydrogenase expression/formation protein HypC
MCLGVPGRIEEIRDDQGTPMASVDFGGIRKDVCLAYLPEAEVGDYTLVHVGFAITRIDEASALETLELIRSIGNLAEELGMEPADLEADPVAREVPAASGGGSAVKYLDEFNDPELAAQQFAEIERIVTRDWALMEVCGGQTHSIVRNGIDQLLPDRSG